MDSLKGKVSIITGVAAKRGMGHGIALKFASEGANVVIVDKFSTPQTFFPDDEGWKGLDAIVAEVKAMGREALPVLADVNNSNDVEKVVTKTLEKFGKIDSLVHCVGIRGPIGVPLVDLDEKIFKNVIEVNLMGSFLIAKAVAKSMIDRGEGGKIVLIASMGGTRGMPGSGSYSASKWGVLGLMKTMALELAKYKINVNAINPGSFQTHLRDEAYTQIAKTEGITIEQVRERFDKKMMETIPLGRIGEIDDIANGALYLVTEQSSYITGEAINIAGGV